MRTSPPDADPDQPDRPDGSTRQSPLFWVTLLGIAWGQSSLLIGTLTAPSSVSVAQAIAIESAGLLAIILVLTFRSWAPRLAGHPRRNAILLGLVAAAAVRTIFSAAQVVAGAAGEGVRASLLVDLVLTLPWYAGLLWLFVRAHDRWRFSVPAVLLLGGVYQAGSDWLLGSVILGGAPIGPSLILLVAIYFWQFIVISSPIMLPASLLVSATPVPDRGVGSRWADAVIPLGWLLPYAMYLVAVLSLLAGPSAG